MACFYYVTFILYISYFVLHGYMDLYFCLFQRFVLDMLKRKKTLKEEKKTLHSSQ